jgi:hypothetical protein
MKATKIMIASLFTFLVVWLSLSFIFFMLSDTSSFRQMASSGGIGMFMLVFGWIPSVVVGMDLDEKLTN